MKLEKILFLYHQPTYNLEVRSAVDAYLIDGNVQEISQILTEGFGVLFKSTTYDFTDYLPKAQESITKIEQSLLKANSAEEKKKILLENVELHKYFILSIAQNLGCSLFLEKWFDDNSFYIKYINPKFTNLFLFEKLPVLRNISQRTPELFSDKLDFPLSSYLVLKKETVKSISLEINKINELTFSDFSPEDAKKDENLVRVREHKKDINDNTNVEEHWINLSELNNSVQTAKELLKYYNNNKDYGLIYVP